MIEELKILIMQFGGIKDVFALFIFSISFFLISSLIKNRVLRILFAVTASSFVILQLISLFFTQSFIGYQFFVHFSLNEADSIYGLYIPHMIFSLILLFIAIFSFYHSHNIVYENLIPKLGKNRYLITTKIISVSIIFMSFFVISTKGDFISDTKSLFSILNVTNISSEKFEKILNKNDIFAYVTPEQIEGKKGKNIIIISLESLEKGFLDSTFSHLTTNLQKLKERWNYYPIEQNLGSGWTSSSLYTYLTGFPAYFGIQGNSIFQTAYHSKISSISHVLEKTGYQTTYINGNTNFSGIKEMLYTFHFNKIIDKYNVPSTGNESMYGIRDKDLFEIAKKEIKTQSSSKQPFALFISTTDTHFPDGIYDKRMEDFISRQESNLEFMVSAVDYMVGDFISFLEKEDILSNTAIFIFPDHLKMGDPSMFEGTGDRGLYVISNVKNDKIIRDTTLTLYQIDLPRIILKGAGIEHNLKFLTDYIHGDKNEYIKNNINQITEINTNGFLRTGSKPIGTLPKISENYKQYAKDTMRYIAHAGGKIDGLKYTNCKEALDLSYKKGFRLFELDIIKTKDGKYVAAHDWKKWSRTTDFRGDTPVTLKKFLELKIHSKYTPLDMAGINNWFLKHKDAVLITDKINEPIKFSKEFVAPDRLMMELFDMKAVKKGIQANIKSAMPSQCIIENISKKDVKKMKEMGVKNIAISRRFISKNIELLQEFKSNDIKPYAFHINNASGIDEEYVSKYEMDYIYGIYADEWSFDQK